MTKQELVSEIAMSTGYDKTSILRVVDAMMFHVRKTMETGESVYLRGFGTFVVKTRAEKVARNISKNMSMIAPEHKIPSFKPSPEFRAQVNLDAPAKD